MNNFPLVISFDKYFTWPPLSSKLSKSFIKTQNEISVGDIYFHLGRDRKTQIFNGLYRFNYMRYGWEINIQTALFFCVDKIDIFCIITVHIFFGNLSKSKSGHVYKDIRYHTITYQLICLYNHKITIFLAKRVSTLGPIRVVGRSENLKGGGELMSKAFWRSRFSLYSSQNRRDGGEGGCSRHPDLSHPGTDGPASRLVGP